FFRLAHPAKRNRSEHSVASLRVRQRWSRHVGCHPSWSNAVHVDPITGKFRAKSFNHTDDSAFAGSVIAMKGFSTLSRGGTDNHDAAGCLSSTPALELHLRDAVLDEPKHAV